MFYLDETEQRQRPNGIDTSLLESYLGGSGMGSGLIPEVTLEGYQRMIDAWKPEMGAEALHDLMRSYSELLLKVNGIALEEEK